jgi:NTP pyrophosphatase (non-canonical NTP hydrolase)
MKHSDMVKGLAKDGHVIQQELKASDCHNLHMCMGLSGELGELIDAIKKSIFYRKPLDRVNAVEELGDIEFYLEGLRQGLGITREETIEGNISKLGARYTGFNYSDKAAIERADK